MDEFDDFPGVERVEVAHGDEAGEVYATPCAEVDDCNNCSDRFEPSNDFTEPALQEDDDWGSEDEQQQTYSNDKYQVAEKMEHALQNRPSEHRLEEIGLRKGKRGSMSDVLAGVASELERNLTIDKLSHELETRPTEHRLEEMNVIKGRRNSNLSNALVGTAVALEKQITHDRLHQALEHRPKQTTTITPPPPPLSKRSSLSNVLAANAKELEKHITADQVSAGLSRRSSLKELMDRGVLKRPPSESHLLAATAVTLEKKLASDRVSDTVALRARTFLGNPTSAERNASEIINTGSGLKERMNAYMAAASGNKSPPIGLDIKERMRAYQDAIKSSSSPARSQQTVQVDSPKVAQIAKVFTETSPSQSIAESKTSESPCSGPSVKERLMAYQGAANTKTPPKAFAETVPLDSISYETEAPTTAEEYVQEAFGFSEKQGYEAPVTQQEVLVMESKQDEAEDEW